MNGKVTSASNILKLSDTLYTPNRILEKSKTTTIKVRDMKTPFREK